MDLQIIKGTLESLQNSIYRLSNDQYIRPVNTLSGSSIGEHCRHIIELFQCLQNGYERGIVNYDSRERNTKIQTNRAYAIGCITAIAEKLSLNNKELLLLYQLNNDMDSMPTNYFRELLYNFEHCVHHQALIKVGLIEMNINLLQDDFGVAVSTLKYRKECAQ